MSDLEAIPTDELIREMLRVNEAYKWSPLFVRREAARRLAAAEAQLAVAREGLGHYANLYGTIGMEARDTFAKLEQP